MRAERKITEDSYADQPAVKDKMCSHYLPIRFTSRHAGSKGGNTPARVGYHRQSGSNDGRRKNLNWPVEEKKRREEVMIEQWRSKYLSGHIRKDPPSPAPLLLRESMI